MAILNLPTSLLAKAGFVVAFLFTCTTLLVHMSPENGMLDNFSSHHSSASPVDNLLDVRNSTLGFERIFVLHMSDRVDKADLWAMASKVTNLSYEFIEGVRGDSVPEKARPALWDTNDPNLGLTTLGCFRGHMNAIQKIVNERIPTALIMEDDTDWDVMLKSQMVEFARGTRWVQGSNDTGLHSPYGDDWDLLWPGHCALMNRANEDGRYYVIQDDATKVPDKHHGDRPNFRWPNRTPPELSGNFTRLVYEPVKPICAFAYALSLKGAEKMLYHFSAQPSGEPIDDAMNRLCTKRLSGANCIGTWPALFESYRAPGNTSRDSDRTGGDGKGVDTFRTAGLTHNIVYPVRPNFDKFIKGEKTIMSQFPPEDVLLPEINYETYEYPKGHGVSLKWTDFQPKTAAAS